MKRKFADRPNWTRILEKEYRQTYVKDSLFNGYITSLYLKKVREPLYVKFDNEEICIVDNGYTWLMHFPEGLSYSTTTTFNREGKIVQWYFDIVYAHGVTDKGIPYIEDLYLDVVYLPDGRLYILDEDELEEALRNDQINRNDYDNAYKTLNEIVETLTTNTNPIIKNTINHFEIFGNNA